MLYLITFADGRQYNTERLARQAAEFGMFDVVKALGPGDFDAEFEAQHREFVNSNARGYGYWIWKPYFIRRTLAQMKEGDVLLYMDAGCTLNRNGKERMAEYVDMVSRSPDGVLAFQMRLEEQNWTKRDTFDAVVAELAERPISSTAKPPQNLAESGQISVAALLLRKCDAALRYADVWYRLASIYHLLDDTASRQPNTVAFQMHRHDQSIASLLIKHMDAVVLPDETYHIDWPRDGARYPIWVTRQLLDARRRRR